MDMERKGGLKCDECEKKIQNGEAFFRKTISVGAFNGRHGTDRRGIFHVCEFLGAQILCRECARKDGVRKFRGCDHIDGGEAERLSARGTCSICDRPLQGLTGVVINDEWLENQEELELISSQSRESYCRDCSHESELVSKWLTWLNSQCKHERGEDWISAYMKEPEIQPKMVEKNPDALGELVLSQETREQIELLAFHINHEKEIRGLGLDSELHPTCSVFNFYGPPGTGKTLTAGRIAKACGYELQVVTCSSLMDPYIGVTEERIVSIFKNAKKHKRILFFDEADSLVSSRITARSEGGVFHNSMVNTILKELEKHTTPVFFATNLPMVYDGAFRRRVLFSVKFDLPSREQQVELFILLSPKRLGPDVRFEALTEDGLSGGDIRNIAYNAAALALKNGREAPSQEDFAKSKELVKMHKKATSRQGEERPIEGKGYI